jgi:hypothetical protein
MTLLISDSHRGDGMIAACARAALLAALVIFGSLFVNREAAASTVLIAASQTANAGLAACGNSRGKELYVCVANVLDRLSADIRRTRALDTRSSLETAASRLRAATTKIEALCAITQCRTVIAGALRLVKAAGGAFVSSWGDRGLSAVAGVLARAVRLIQSRG